MKRAVTFLAVGDWADYDSFMKFHKEKSLLINNGFDYVHVSYRDLIQNELPHLDTKKVVVHLFFPFEYWDREVEPKNYKGVYGNRLFYDKFIRFWKRIDRSIRNAFIGKKLYFVNPPVLSGEYRDKLKVNRLIREANIPTPKLYRMKSISDIYKCLDNGHKLFVKVRYGSMGKGITFLSNLAWKTNFTYRNRQIFSRKSDHGWRFKDITNKADFLKELLGRDVYAEEAIDSITVAGRRFDLRIYVFFNKVLYIYPRSNMIDSITTNISQGGRGEPQRFLRVIHPEIIDSAKKVSVTAVRALGLNFAGVDVIVDNNQRDVYVLDVNIFPGFPRRRLFNLSRYMVNELERLYR